MRSLKRILFHDARDDQAEFPRRPYKVTRHKDRSVNHWGQRKLMLSEVEFLTLMHQELVLAKKQQGEKIRPIMVYAGAAPGNHIPFLAEMFLDFDFILVDPADFSSHLSDPRFSSQSGSPVHRRCLCGGCFVRVIKGFFTSETVQMIREQYPNREFLFVSDIRTADPKVKTEEEIEACVVEDMENQAKWACELKSFASMHKFRLPWGEGVSNYLDGDIYLPIWGPQTTTETRLIVRNHQPRAGGYNNRKYEQQMFHFNQVTRVEYYVFEDNGYYRDHIPGLDHCYDCAAEMFVLEEYVMKVQKDSHNQRNRDLFRAVSNLSIDLNHECSPTGKRDLCAQIDANQRRKWFDPRSYDTKNWTLTKVQSTTPTKPDADPSLAPALAPVPALAPSPGPIHREPMRMQPREIKFWGTK